MQADAGEYFYSCRGVGTCQEGNVCGVQAPVENGSGECGLPNVVVPGLDRGLDQPLELIVVASFPGRPGFRGLGELTADELETLWPTRRRTGRFSPTCCIT